MMLKPRGLFLGLVLLATSCTAANSSRSADAQGCSPGEPREDSAAGLRQIELCVESGGKTHSLVVEVAEGWQQQQRGLMFRTELADNRGMFFPFDETRTASFWMKNTVIPLDIIFIRADGTIENIEEDTIPYSTFPVLSTGPVIAVLELRGGLTGEVGIAAGDKVRWKPAK
jgi:uncharacterized protein